MILQIDSRLRGAINQKGCYYMCLINLANLLSNCRVDVELINETLWYEAIREGWMTTSCFINNPSGIVNHLCEGSGIKVTYTGVHEKATYKCKPGEYEIIRYKRIGDYGHFVRGDGNGNVAYDPMGESRTVKEGDPVSKRIFRIT